ncbi:MAG: hypothetical protein ACYTGB_12350 [Planctomycetota bacterium]
MKEQILSILYRSLEHFFGKPGESLGLDPAALVKEHFSGFWDDQGMYPLARLYVLDAPENPWRGNPVLPECARLMARKLFAQDEEVERRAFSPLVRTYALLRDELPDASEWKREIQRLFREDMLPRLRETDRLTVLSSANVGYGTNHLAMLLMGLSAYVHVFRGDSDFAEMDPGGPEIVRLAESWLERFMAYMDEGGYWPESDGPAQGYNTLTSSCLFRAAIDLGLLEEYRARLGASAAYHARHVFANLETTGVTDGRNPAGRVRTRMNVCGLLPEGRFVMEKALERCAEESAAGRRYTPEGCNIFCHLLDELPYMCAERRDIWSEGSWCFVTGQQFSVQKSGPWMSAASNIQFRPRPEGHWNLDYQNLFSLYHAAFGTVFRGSHSKNDPELSTFNKAFTTFDGKPLEKPMWKYVPGQGRFQAGERGFSLWRDYRGFEGMIELEAVDEKRCRVRLDVNARRSEYPINCSLQPAVGLGRGFTGADGKEYEVTEDPFSITGSDLGGALVLRPEERPCVVGEAAPRPVRISIPDDAELYWPFRGWDTYNLETDRYVKPKDWTAILRVPVGEAGVELTVEVL